MTELSDRVKAALHDLGEHRKALTAVHRRMGTAPALLSQGPDPNATRDAYGRTPLEATAAALRTARSAGPQG
jgi:hypothetical protein